MRAHPRPTPALVVLMVAFAGLAPLAAAQGEAPLVPGAFVAVSLNLAPQELLPSGAPDPAAGGASTTQRLASVQTYDCATGVPSTNGARYTFDVVMVATHPLLSGNVDAALFDAAVSDPGSLSAERLTHPAAPTTYGAAVYAGTGRAASPSLLPGTVSFAAFLYCGAAPATALPRAEGRQTQGIFGFHDELEWSASGTAKHGGPEFTFTHRAPAPGEVSLLTPGFYMNEVLFVDPTALLGTHTFRFVVNPSLVADYPGYVGSRYTPPDQACLIGESGAFGRCGATVDLGLTKIPGQYQFLPTAAAVPEAGLVPPALEDVDRFGSPDGLVGLDLVSRAYYEAQAADTFVGPTLKETYLEANRVAFPPRGLEPQNSGGDTETPVRRVVDGLPGLVEAGPTAGWVYYLDVSRSNSAAGTSVANSDALYLTGLSNLRDVYPGTFRFSALLGLARDTNGDDRISLHEPSEWFPLDDFLPRTGGAFGEGVDLADVGASGLDAAAPADAVTSTEQMAWTSTCRLDGPTSRTRVVPAGEAAPAGDPDIEACAAAMGIDRAGAPGWGTFLGRDAGEAALGFYESSAAFLDGTATQQGTLTSQVSARIAWPTVEEAARVGLVLPAGIDLAALAGTVVILTDVDVYQGRL